MNFSDLTPKSTTGNTPLIGNIIPSRWAYEALAVTSFADNRYERLFFDADKAKYENQYYLSGLLYELQSQLETQRDEQQRGKTPSIDRTKIIQTNLPELTAYCGMQPYQGDYDYTSLHQYLADAKQLLVRRGNKATLTRDRLITAYIRDNSKEALLKLKRENYNLKLEEFVMGADQGRLLDIVDGHAVPRMSTIFLTPRSIIGQAPFYSSEKILGAWHIKTLWFNVGILLLMCAGVAFVLFLNDK